MAKGQPPIYRFLTKPEGSDELVEIGQVWKTAKAEVFSVTLDLENNGGIMVPNTPKPRATVTEIAKPAA